MISDDKYEYPYIFLHITKTAGGTLKTAVQEAYGKNVRFVYSAEEVDSIIDSNLDRLKLVYGHQLFGVHKLLNLAPRYMCFVRHPVQRTISHFYHLQNVDKGPVGKKIQGYKSIDDFFDKGEHWEFENLMSKIISGDGREKEIDVGALFSRAKHNLHENFEFVGIQEFFSLSVRVLSEILGRKLEIENNVNIGYYDERFISKETIEKIEYLNDCDMKIYKYCINRFLES